MFLGAPVCKGGGNSILCIRKFLVGGGMGGVEEGGRGGGKRRTQAEGERWPPRRRNDGLGRRWTQEEKEGIVSLPLPLCSFLPPLCSFPDSLTLRLALRLSTPPTLSLSGTLSPSSHSDSLTLKLILTLRPLTLRNSQTTQTHNHIQTTNSDHSRTLRPTL